MNEGIGGISSVPLQRYQPPAVQVAETPQSDPSQVARSETQVTQAATDSQAANSASRDAQSQQEQTPQPRRPEPGEPGALFSATV